MLLRTTTVPWRLVREVREAPIHVSGRGGPMLIPVRMICFELTGGSTIETQIHGARPGETPSPRTPGVLPAARFDEVLAWLRRFAKS